MKKINKQTGSELKQNNAKVNTKFNMTETKTG